MRRSASIAVVVLALAGVTACSEDEAVTPSPVAPTGWHVADSAIKDPEGRTVVMRGMNLAGAHKFKPYWGFQQPEDYARVRTDWGMSSIRFLTTWAAIEPEEGVFDEDYLAELDRRVGWAEDAGLLVVIDMHQDLYGEGFAGGDGAPAWTCDPSLYAAFVPTNPWALGYFDPNMEACFQHFYTDENVVQRFTEAWVKVSQLLAHHQNIVGFDVLNEPAWDASSLNHYEANLLQPLYEKVVPAVRKVAPQWLAFLEPGGSRNAGIPTSLTKFPFDNVVYAAHNYDITAEGTNGFDPSRRDLVMNDIAALGAEAKTLGAALWIGEYGGLASNPGIQDYMSAECDGAGAVAAGSEYWAYDESDGFSILDPQGNEKPALAEVIIRPYPERVAGTLSSYAYDLSTKTLTFVMKADPSITAPTVVSLPPRIFPSGASVDCGGCTVTPSAEGVELTGLPKDQLTVTVAPL